MYECNIKHTQIHMHVGYNCYIVCAACCIIIILTELFFAIFCLSINHEMYNLFCILTTECQANDNVFLRSFYDSSEGDNQTAYQGKDIYDIQ